MNQKDAAYLLFVKDFGNGPLFKNPTELAIDLINTEGSDYYTDKTDTNNYNKSISRLKAYLSQLFSESARRNVTNEFKNSLLVVLNHKTINTDIESLAFDIITNLRERNIKFRSEGIKKNNANDNYLYSDFYKNIIEAKYVAVFTAREIRFEYEYRGIKFSFVDFLIQNLLDELKTGGNLKFYRFNFPLEQTCQLFWRGLRKELTKFLKKDKNVLGSLIAISRSKGWFTTENDKTNQQSTDSEQIENMLASNLLELLSKKNIINVFHLQQPVYLVPSISINPNDGFGQEQNTYLLIQSNQSEESLHKFSNEEFIYWKLFVWDNLKRNDHGKLVKYSYTY